MNRKQFLAEQCAHRGRRRETSATQPIEWMAIYRLAVLRFLFSAILTLHQFDFVHSRGTNWMPSEYLLNSTPQNSVAACVKLLFSELKLFNWKAFKASNEGAWFDQKKKQRQFSCFRNPEDSAEDRLMIVCKEFERRRGLACRQVFGMLQKRSALVESRKERKDFLCRWIAQIKAAVSKICQSGS